MKTHAEHAELLWQALPRHPYLVLRAMRYIVNKNIGTSNLDYYFKITKWLWTSALSRIEPGTKGDKILRVATVEIKRSLAELEAIDRIMHQ